jgi:hypothetical protein
MTIETATFLLRFQERIWICQGQLHGYFSCRQQGKCLTSCSMPSSSMISSLSWREWGEPCRVERLARGLGHSCERGP